MRATGKMGNITDREASLGRTGRDTRGSGEAARKTAMESSKEHLEKSMKENG